jgi:hypothetical protein
MRKRTWGRSPGWVEAACLRQYECVFLTCKSKVPKKCQPYLLMPRVVLHRLLRH